MFMDIVDQKRCAKKKDRRNAIYESVINKRTTQSLQKMEHEFEELHRDDSDKALLEYVLREALRLGHVPGEKEITGWTYLISRFGSWDNVLKKASLKYYKSNHSGCGNTLRIEETERQKALYKERKREKKIKAQNCLKQQKEAALRNEAWIASHPGKKEKKAAIDK